MFSGMRNPMEP